MPVIAQRVVLGRHLRRGERGVDAVEVGVRRDERRHARRRRPATPRGQRGEPLAGAAARRRLATRRRREAAAEPAAEAADERGAGGERAEHEAGAAEELAAIGRCRSARRRGGSTGRNDSRISHSAPMPGERRRARSAATTCHGAPARRLDAAHGADRPEQPDADDTDDEAVAQGDEPDDAGVDGEERRRCRRAGPACRSCRTCRWRTP